MILVDAVVLIAYQRTADAKLAALFRSLPLATCGVTRAEILHGTRNPTDRQHLLTFLNAFQQVSIPDALCDVIGANLATLRAAGVTVPFPDVVLATVALANDIELWTRDQHFTLIQGALPALKLFQEPP